jgi:two-component system response regulator (stage 0 sporulation protein A)
MENKPMKLIILEDEEKEINRFISSIKAREEFELVCATNSCYKAIKEIKNAGDIEGVILDIELNNGEGGSGLDFLNELNILKLDIRPAIIVTTQVESDLIFATVRQLKVDMIFCKNKPDYTPNIILNQFISMRPAISSRKISENSAFSYHETEAERLKRIGKKINEELNLIGISAHLKGRQYIFDAILFLIENENRDNAYYTNYLKEKYKIRNSTINISIQDAINKAWRNTPNEDILEHFNANISYANGTPTPVQFIHFYVDKIKREI